MSDELNLDDRPLAKRKRQAFEQAQKRIAPQPTPAPAAAPEAEAPAATRPAERPSQQATKRATRQTARMVDVGAKPDVQRTATATGYLRIGAPTRDALRAGTLEKGDAFTVARVAAIQAVKATPTLLPLCHPIPVTGTDVKVGLEGERVRADVTVRATYRTGVEMEALTAVTVALLTVWDMVKSLEKDAAGQYPLTRLEDVHVVQKAKGDPS